MFYVGQKVVRVRSAHVSGGGIVPAEAIARLGHSAPALGEVVTIRAINTWSNWTALRFEEHHNEQFVADGVCGIEPGFNAQHFRPVVERKTDISIFTAMLNPSKVEMPA